jgi:hypothetical protein
MGKVFFSTRSSPDFRSKEMIWNAWVRNARYVRVGSTSKIKLFSIAEFERFAEEMCRTVDAAARTRSSSPRSETTQARPKSAEELIRQVVIERDDWRRRATEAEAKLAIRLDEPTGPDKKFQSVKRLIGRALHPDATNNTVEKAVRAALFKEIWPQVLKIGEE